SLAGSVRVVPARTATNRSPSTICSPPATEVERSRTDRRSARSRSQLAALAYRALVPRAWSQLGIRLHRKEVLTTFTPAPSSGDFRWRQTGTSSRRLTGGTGRCGRTFPGPPRASSTAPVLIGATRYRSRGCAWHIGTDVRAAPWDRDISRRSPTAHHVGAFAGARARSPIVSWAGARVDHVTAT